MKWSIYHFHSLGCICTAIKGIMFKESNKYNMYLYVREKKLAICFHLELPSPFKAMRLFECKENVVLYNLKNTAIYNSCQPFIIPF